MTVACSLLLQYCDDLDPLREWYETELQAWDYIVDFSDCTLMGDFVLREPRQLWCYKFLDLGTAISDWKERRPPPMSAAGAAYRPPSEARAEDYAPQLLQHHADAPHLYAPELSPSETQEGCLSGSLAHHLQDGRDWGRRGWQEIVSSHSRESEERFQGQPEECSGGSGRRSTSPAVREWKIPRRG